MSGKESVLIVGGTGFIGMHITREAINLGFHVLVLSKNATPLLGRINDVEYISVDITLEGELFNKINGRTLHYVINLGGYIDHSNYTEGGDQIFNVHFNGVKNLVNCINKDHLKSFIQIGSSDEYGGNLSPQSECQRESPISPYSFAKTAATHLLQMLYVTENFPVIILRLFLVYGPGQDSSRFIPQVIQGCLNNDKFPVSPGEQLRDFCFISDIVDAIFLSIGNDYAYGEVFNIATGEPNSVRNIVSTIQEKIGSGAPQFGKFEYRVGENMLLFAEISKAKRILGWKPRVGLNEGLDRVISYYK